MEINYVEQINSNINESYQKFDTINSNDFIDDIITIYDNRQKTKALSERAENINKNKIFNIN